MTRLNENASYEVVGEIRKDIHDFLAGGTILDLLVELKTESAPLKARLITYKDPLTGKVFRFLSNLFDTHSHTIVLLYKNHWEIERFFKKNQAELQAGLFFLGQPGRNQNPSMDGADCQSDIQRDPQTD
ncbi:hypothetical protein SYJ56_22680 [Algoriphagus sp. D3-2-R+10]|uniref:hypothetical protein n=1 Tax=Algoriphagus aurantiacus TaxID=3103948 RepID=UPI002B3FAC15|nr:hypothetical protein [Algoriphagus sp. D3-2-R+10]MEB2778135.1 hypothetical protein [Algoriphagus sp. D3-2-R+10]